MFCSNLPAYKIKSNTDLNSDDDAYGGAIGAC